MMNENTITAPCNVKHLVVHGVRKHFAVEREQMRPQNQRENARQKQSDRNADQVHDPDPFMVKRKRPRLPPLGAVEEVDFRRFKDFFFLVLHLPSY